MKVYITKYALTVGIIEREAEIDGKYPDMIRDKYGGFYHKPHWHTSMEDAVIHARQMRDKKIITYKKRLAKLEATMFGHE